jgi:NTP pyrophosphatase (non-canonical NTP hydrolase)
MKDTSESNLIKLAVMMADSAEDKFGKHLSADFACCRIAEEVGELIQATTSISRGRGLERRGDIRAEAVDSIAMILRLVRDYPDGSPPKQL